MRSLTEKNKIISNMQGVPLGGDSQVNQRKPDLNSNERSYWLEKVGRSGVSGLFKRFLLNNPLMTKWTDKQQGRRQTGKVQRFD